LCLSQRLLVAAKTPRFGPPAPSLSEAGPTSAGVVVCAPAVAAEAASTAVVAAHATARMILRPIDLTSLSGDS
jgi:hypothetical protein